jgi:hypothetical protein
LGFYYVKRSLTDVAIKIGNNGKGGTSMPPVFLDYKLGYAF